MDFQMSDGTQFTGNTWAVRALALNGCGGPEDPAWSADDAHLVEVTRQPLEAMGWLRREEVVSSRVVRVGHAYPVLSLDFESSLVPIRRYLEGFSNLVLAGRNGRFEYSWIHDMMREGRNTAQGAS
jgi:protoporphyrinogen oxidase